MSRLLNTLWRFWRDEEGATMVEYALMVALIAIVLVATIFLIGEALDSIFSTVASELNNSSS